MLSAVFADIWNYDISYLIGGLSVIVVVVFTASPLIRLFRGKPIVS